MESARFCTDMARKRIACVGILGASSPSLTSSPSSRPEPYRERRLFGMGPKSCSGLALALINRLAAIPAIPIRRLPPVILLNLHIVNAKLAPAVAAVIEPKVLLTQTPRAVARHLFSHDGAAPFPFKIERSRRLQHPEEMHRQEHYPVQMPCRQNSARTPTGARLSLLPLALRWSSGSTLLPRLEPGFLSHPQSATVADSLRALLTVALRCERFLAAIRADAARDLSIHVRERCRRAHFFPFRFAVAPAVAKEKPGQQFDPLAGYSHSLLAPSVPVLRNLVKYPPALDSPRRSTNPRRNHLVVVCAEQIHFPLSPRAVLHLHRRHCLERHSAFRDPVAERCASTTASERPPPLPDNASGDAEPVAECVCALSANGAGKCTVHTQPRPTTLFERLHTWPRNAPICPGGDSTIAVAVTARTRRCPRWRGRRRCRPSCARSRRRAGRWPTRWRCPPCR